MLKRLMVAAALMVLALSAGAAAARAHDDDSAQTVVRPRSFTIPKGQCSQLPADLVVQGQGIERLTTKIDNGDEADRHDGDADDDDEGEGNENEGGVTLSISSRITGTATDNHGGTYTFVYQNRLHKTPIPGSGIDTDSFKLKGTGAASGMFTFFRARVTFDSNFNFVGFEILEQVGDPFHCDPL
jgi:hypothetical protein